MASSRSKIVSAVFWPGKLLYGALTTSPDAFAAWKNERLVNVCDGTSANQWSNVPNPRAIVACLS